MNEIHANEKDSEILSGTLGSENKNHSDWHTKLTKIDKAKIARYETQKARKGKPITFSRK